MPLDSVESSGEVATATRDIEIAAGTIPAGTVAGQRMTVIGRRHGEELITFSATWYCSAELDADWDLRGGGWRVTVEGDCPLDIDIRLAIPLERMAETTPGYTANRAVNAVPVVCGAAPGHQDDSRSAPGHCRPWRGGPRVEGSAVARADRFAPGPSRDAILRAQTDSTYRSWAARPGRRNQPVTGIQSAEDISWSSRRWATVGDRGHRHRRSTGNLPTSLRVASNERA